MKNITMMIFMCLVTMAMTATVSAQTQLRDAEILESVTVGPKEFSSVLDKTTGCVHRTSLHTKHLFQDKEQVKIKNVPGAQMEEVFKPNLPEVVYLEEKNCNANQIIHGNSAKPYNAPDSPFPHCQKDPNPIGGDEGYDDILQWFDSDIHITSFTGAVDFKNTIENAPPGSIIFIDGNLVINLSNLYALTGDNSITVPAGVTIASDRGLTNGALIYTTDFDYYNSIFHKGLPLFVVGGDQVRFTGIRFQGPYQSQGSNSPTSNIRFKSCIEMAGGNAGLEVDNNVFYGWPYVAVRIGRGYGDGSFKKNIIHHNYFYNNRQKGFGYGVMVDWGYCHIYSNTFQANRHGIAGTGKKNSGYEASCNTVWSGGTSHNFDMHAEGSSDGTPNAGRFMYIHHNDFEDVGAKRYQPGNDHNIYVRGRPDVQCRIENNRFRHSGPQAAIKQANAHGGYGNMLILNNIYDKDDYLGWYVKEKWLKTEASNFMNLPSSNDWFMTNPIQGSSYAYNFTFGDYDGDGNTDVFKLENGTLYRIPYDADSYGIGADWQAVLTTGYPFSSLQFGFYNNDNRTDIIRQGGGTIYVSWGANSNWSTLVTTNYNLGTLWSGDFDGNGVEDLFLTTGSLWRVSYNSNSNWQTINTSGYQWYQLKLGRFNNNLKSDVFLANGSNFRVSYEGTGSWVTTATSNYLTQNLDVADFDGDNISDVIRPYDRRVSLSGNTTWKLMRTGFFPISTFTYGDF